MNEKRKVALSSVVAAVFITGLKLVVGIQTNSLGILSEAAHSALDFLAAAMTYFAVTVSDRPADKKHPYGHGKVESVSALFETLLLVVTCAWIIWEAIQRIFYKSSDVDSSIWGFVVIIFTILVDISRSIALSRAAKKHHSEALEADALHFSSDVASSIVVLIGLIFVAFNIDWVDSVAALVVAVIVLSVCYRLGKRTIDTLLDTSLPEDEEEWLDKYLKSLPNPVNGYHGLRTRRVGVTRYIEFHLEVDPLLSVEVAHTRGDEISSEIMQHFPGANVIVHLDPYDDSASNI